MNTFRNMGIGSGLILVVIGIIFLAFPAFTMVFFTTLVGLGILVIGISITMAWYKDMRGTGMGGGALFAGVICIIFSLVCLIHPLALATTMTWLVALAVVVCGIAQICGLVAMTGAPGRTVGIVGSAVVVLFGLLALLQPELVIQFMGISLLIEGITAIVMALAMQQR
jgi:uncharacterized membrane protein HdeD (DUF308 family)